MSETNFDNLPREMVEIILDHVDLSERQRLRRVSKFWDRNIVNLYGAIVTVHNANLEFILDSNSSPINAYFQSLTLPIPMNDTGIDFLNNLTSLTFSGLVVCYNIFPVLEKCIHVRKLDLISFNLNPQMKEYQVNNDDPSKLLPALRGLSVRFDYEPFNESNFTFLKKLLPFFTSENGKLDSIVLDCPDQVGPLEITFDKIFKKNSFQEWRRWDGRERLFDQTIPDEFYSELIVSNFQTLRNLELADGKYRSRTNMKIYGKIETGCPEVQFTEFDQSIYSYLKTGENFAQFIDTECITLFGLLKPQIHLTKFTIVILNTFTLDQVFLITDNNLGTLKCLTINYGCLPLYRHLVLDSSYLSRLTLLEVFKFLDFSHKKPVRNQNVETFASISIINLNFLPTSLRVFSTSSTLQFAQEDDFNMTIFERLENLKTFELTALPFFQFGEERIYKMDAMKIRQLIAWTPSLTKLVLRNSRLLVPQTNERNPELCPRTDSLPNSAMDWINAETYISVEKLPIDFGSPKIYGNPNLIGQHSEWDWNQIHMEAHEPAPDNEFPLRFDANILMDSEFRGQRSTLLD